MLRTSFTDPMAIDVPVVGAPMARAAAEVVAGRPAGAERLLRRRG